MRWADLDELSHVNNVTYLDYAHEARAVHVAAGELADRAVGAVSVEFLRPLLLSRTPLHVTSSDDGVRLVQEIGPATSTSAWATRSRAAKRGRARTEPVRADVPVTRRCPSGSRHRARCG